MPKVQIDTDTDDLNSKEHIEFVNIFKNLYTVFKKHGIQKFSTLIKKFDYIESKNEITKEFILSCVCDKLDINRNDLYDDIRKGNVSTGRKICVLLFNNHLKMTEKEISLHFNRNRQLVTNSKSQFSKLNPKSKADKEIIAYYNLIESDVLKFMKSQEDADHCNAIIKED